jgi:hypothetical protein
MGEHSIWITAVLVTAGACHSEAPSTTTTASSRVVPPDEARVRLTNARCEREIICNHIGDGQAFADRGACERDLRARANAELVARECARGILEPQLEDCLSSVRREACGNPFHTAERLDLCADGRLCADD